MIIGVLLIGIAINFFQVLTLEPAGAWLDDRQDGVPTMGEPPGVLASMAKMMSRREQEGMRISALAMRSNTTCRPRFRAWVQHSAHPFSALAAR